MRELCFQVFQLPHELVVFVVGNDGSVENVIPVVVVVDLFPELIDSLFGLRFVHLETFCHRDLRERRLWPRLNIRSYRFLMDNFFGAVI
jgi:hypothetical protein